MEGLLCTYQEVLRDSFMSSCIKVSYQVPVDPNVR